MNIKAFSNGQQSTGVRTLTGNHVVILMRTQNEPVLLARALASVLAQTHTGWHVYLIDDDKNPDAVDALVRRYDTAFDGRLTLMRHTGAGNLSTEASLNAALRLSRGNFVAVHDSDDSWHPEFLAATTAFLGNEANRSHAAVVTHCATVSEHIEDDVCIVEQYQLYGRFNAEMVDFEAMLRVNQFPSISLLTRRSVIDRIGEFDENTPVLGGWDYNIRILQEGDIGVIPDILAYCHQRRVVDGADDASGSGEDKRRLTKDKNNLIRSMIQANPGYAAFIRVIDQLLAQDREKVAHEYESTNRMMAQMSGVVDQISALVDQIAKLYAESRRN